VTTVNHARADTPTAGPGTPDLLTRLFGASELPQDAATPPFWQAFVLAALGLVIKAPDSLTLPQFWAEDGQIFFAEQHGQLLPPLFTTYASYLHFVPRLVAWLASAFAPLWAPTIYCLSAWLGGALALVSLRQLRMGVPYWMLLAGVILTPSNGEAFGTLTNVQWLSQFYLLATLCRLIRGDVSKAPRSRLALTLLLALTGPFSIFTAFVGMLLVLGTRLLSPRYPRLQRVRWNADLTVLSLCALVQLLCLPLSRQSGAPSPGKPTLEGALTLLSYAELHTLGAEPLSRLGFWLLFMLLAGLSLWWLRAEESRYAVLAMLAYCGIQLLGVIGKCAYRAEQEVGVLGVGDRYFIVYKALFVWFLAVSIVHLTQGRERLRHGLFVALLLAPLPYTWPILHRPPFPDSHWKEQAARIDVEPETTIHFWPNWSVTLKRRGSTP
jgi:hypothetical protein